MIRFLLISAIVVACPVVVIAQDDQDAVDVAGHVQIDPAQTAPLLIFDTVGGMQFAPPEWFKKTPLLKVYADGRVVCGHDRPQLQEVESKISEARLQSLMDFIVNENHFFKIDTEQIKQGIAATGRPVLLTDAETSRFTVQLGDRSHTVELYGIKFTGPKYPEVTDVKCVWQIEKKARQLIGLAHVGDDTTMDAILKRVNRKLAKQDPKRSLMTADNFVTANRMKNGMVSAIFVKHYKDPDTGIVDLRVAAIYERQGEERPKVKIYGMGASDFR